LLVIISQIVSQAAYADIKTFNKASTLATPSLFQESSPDERSEEFRQSVLSDIKLLTVAFSIGFHFLADNRRHGTLERSLRNEFRDNQPLLETLNEINLARVRRLDNIVRIPCRRGKKKFEIRICSRERLESLPTAGSQWAISNDWAIQVVAKNAAAAMSEGSLARAEESLTGHGFTDEELDKIDLIPWRESEDFRTAVEVDLPKIIGELPAPARLRQKLLETLEIFKEGKDGCKMGITQARYINAERWFLEYGTSQSIGIAADFFDKASFREHLLQALFHAVFHAMRNREEDEDDPELRTKVMATAHLDAMRFSALKFWNVPFELWDTVRTATQRELKGPNQELLPGVVNKLGNAIRAWKLEQSKIPTRMAEDNWKALLSELHELLRPKRPNVTAIFKLFELCSVNSNPIFGDSHRYPTESRYPILRAVTLLSVEHKKKLKNTLINPKNAERLAISPIADSIILMLNSIPEGWMGVNAPKIKDCRVWDVSPEIWHAGGGLGRVKQFEGIEMIEFLRQAGIPLSHIEPCYHSGRNRFTGKLEELDYSKILGIRDDAPAEEKLHEVYRVTIKVGEDTALAVCYRAVNEHGIETFLIKGFRNGQNIEKDVPYYTPALYDYDSWYKDGQYNPDHRCTRDEFAYFFSAASLELIKHTEEISKGVAEATGKGWQAPVMHFSDGQLGLAPYLKKTRYANDPILKDAFVAYTTHTYFNRQAFQQKFAIEVPEQKYLLRPSGISYEDEKRYFEHHMDLSEKSEDKNVSVCDYSSAGIRCADWVNGVSAEHVRRLLQLEYDNRGDWTNLDLVAVTNGDVRRLTAARYRQAMREVCGADVDVEEPTSEQAAKTKKRTKEMLNTEFGTSLDTCLPVLSYSGRGVDEKAGRHRALSDYNIEEMVKMGLQVVIGCNVQADPNIIAEWERLEERLRTEKASHPDIYKGKFVLMRNIDIMVQRAILAASDFQVQDSDPITEAAGFSEADISVCGGIEIAPPWREGILQMQGIRMNLNELGEGNYLIPEIEVSEKSFPLLRRPHDPAKNKEIGDAYLAIIGKVLNLGETMEDTMRKLSHYQATSVRLSRVLEARLTVAEYLRQWSNAIEEKEKKAAKPGEQDMTVANPAQKEWDRMNSLHDIDKDLPRAIPDGKTRWLVVPVTLCPRDPLYNQRTKFVEFVNEMNRLYPEVREKIRIVSDKQDLIQTVRTLSSDPNNMVSVALDSEECLEKMPDGVRMLIFKPEDDDLGNFRQLEGIIAALRVLYIDDFAQRKAKLERIYELMTGEHKEVPDISDLKEFARQFQFILPPIIIKNKQELKRLNDNLLRLIESA